MRLVAESRAHHELEWAAITSAAAKLGVGCAETVRKWVRQAQTDAGAQAGMSSQGPGTYHDLRNRAASRQALRR